MIEIDKSALRDNYQTFAALIEPSLMAPVLKSNAYGHGLNSVYAAIKDFSPPWLCVAYQNEAESLRSMGYKGRILIVAPFTYTQLADLAKLDCDILITHEGLLDEYLNFDKPIRAHIKVDTGLSRQGFLYSEIVKLKAKLRSKPIVGISTHFANVEDVVDQDFSHEQLRVFNEAYTALGIKCLRHSSASAGTLLIPESRFDFCRVGISLYGVWPSEKTRLALLSQYPNVKLNLKPVMQVKSHVDLVKMIPKGSYVGYGCTVKVEKDTKIAVIPFGYYEGLPRVISFSSSAYVLIKGQRCPFLGRISMNMSVVNVSHVSDVKHGDDVTVLGRDGLEHISVDDLASWGDTISYEILTGFR
jgi:alanine racemase